MATIRQSITIDRPVDKVFDYVTDFEKLPEWETSILESVKTSEGPMGIGTTYRGVIKAMGMKMEWTSRVTEYETHARLDETIISGKTTIYEREIFDETEEGGTDFTLVHEYRIGGFLRLITPILILTMLRQMKKNLQNLKRILEGEGQSI